MLKNENSKADLLENFTSAHHWDFVPTHTQRDSLGLPTWLVFDGVALHARVATEGFPKLGKRRVGSGSTDDSQPSALEYIARSIS